jgi:hypothetical protein
VLCHLVKIGPLQGPVRPATPELPLSSHPRLRPRRALATRGLFLLVVHKFDSFLLLPLSMKSEEANIGFGGPSNVTARDDGQNYRQDKCGLMDPAAQCCFNGASGSGALRRAATPRLAARLAPRFVESRVAGGSAGVAPLHDLKPVKNFTDRKAALARISAAVQLLSPDLAPPWSKGRQDNIDR